MLPNMTNTYEIARQYGYPNVTDAYQPEVVLMLVKPGKFYMTINLTKMVPCFNDEVNDHVFNTEAINKGNFL